ncbi:hypothetical protein B0H21DRAFT_823618 [Amylocystis lapponica]|nr:hypothetical protein B0H21DRAFT_823618 [Amylocystis lapponica]
MSANKHRVTRARHLPHPGRCARGAHGAAGAIEQTQERLAEDLEVVRLQLGRVHQHGKEQLKGKVDKLADTPAASVRRLLNATVNVKKGAIKAPVTESGKPPPNFPATKGEYEHMTKERYELIMKAYGLPIKGDTTAKREALREFLGLAAFE